VDITDDQQGSYEVRQRDDLQHDAVCFTYEQVSSDGSYSSITDIWPPSANQRGFRTLRRTFDFQAPSGTTYAANIQTAAFPTTAGGWASWLQSYHPALSQSIVSGQSRVTGLTVKSPLPATTYVRQLTSDVFPDWLTEAAAADDNLRLRVSYTEMAADGATVIRKVEDREIVVPVTSTNATTKQYTRIISLDSGDPLPDTGAGGLANEIYNWVSVLPFEGGLERTAAEFPTDITLGVRLNLSGGETAWETMASAVNTLDIDIANGTVRCEFGPPEYLGPQDRISLLQITRGRLTFQAAITQSSGFGSTLSLDTGLAVRADGGDGAKDLISEQRLAADTAAATPHVQIKSAPAANAYQLNLVQPTGVRSIRADTVNTSSKLVLADGDKIITIDTSALPAGAQMSIISVQVCDPDTGENRTGYVLGYIP
jgi:hypothetical protein